MNDFGAPSHSGLARTSPTPTCWTTLASVGNKEAENLKRFGFGLKALCDFSPFALDSEKATVTPATWN